MIVRYADVRSVLTSPASSRNVREPGLPRMVGGAFLDDDPAALMNQDPPEHTRYRRILHGTFTPRHIERWRPRAAASASELIDAAGQEFDMVADFALPLPARVICEMLGVPMDRFDQVRGWTEMFLSTSDASADARAQGFAAFTACARELIEQRRAEPGEDLIDLLIEARDDEDGLSEDELTNMVFTLILAGHETTASMIVRGVFRLLCHAEQYAELAARPELVDPAVEEILRHEAPGSNGMLRRITEDVEVSGGTIPAGTVVLPNLWAADHDPTAFQDPLRFDVHRFTGAPSIPHLAFGHGPHHCLGANLARMELQEAFHALVTRLPGLHAQEDLSAVVWSDGFVYWPRRLLSKPAECDACGPDAPVTVTGALAELLTVQARPSTSCSSSTREFLTISDPLTVQLSIVSGMTSPLDITVPLDRSGEDAGWNWAEAATAQWTAAAARSGLDVELVSTEVPDVNHDAAIVDVKGTTYVIKVRDGDITAHPFGH